MPGHVIGENLNFGFAGTPSRMSDCVIAPYLYDSENTANIQFGEAVALDTDGHIVAASSTKAPIGIAVRHLGQPHVDANDGWYYAPGDTVDVLLRGSIVVEIDGAVTPAAPVYFNATTKKFTATSSGMVAVPGAVFAGKKDTNNVGEITLTARKI